MNAEEATDEFLALIYVFDFYRFLRRIRRRVILLNAISQLHPTIGGGGRHLIDIGWGSHITLTSMETQTLSKYVDPRMLTCRGRISRAEVANHRGGFGSRCMLLHLYVLRF